MRELQAARPAPVEELDPQETLLPREDRPGKQAGSFVLSCSVRVQSVCVCVSIRVRACLHERKGQDK